MHGRFFRSWIDLIWCWLRFGAGPNDYIRYEFYRKSNYERNKFITYRRSQHLINDYNSKELFHFFEDKADFNQRFSRWVKREWLDLRKASYEEYIGFLNKHNSVIMKPVTGGQGSGIFVLDSREGGNADDYSKYRDYLAEEIIHQHPAMNKINPSSVNTIRVWTFKGKIIATALRSGGSDSCLDNLHANGVCAYLDEDTGMITHPCIDIVFNKYLIHPYSGIKLLGFEVPNWDVVLREVEKAAQVIPEVAYIGWDVAILEDGIELIEGNADPGHDLMQMVIQNGCYTKIKELK